MKLTKEIMIGRNAVQYFDSLGDYEIYKYTTYGGAILYFCMDDTVVCALNIETGCSQNVGFLEDLTLGSMAGVG